MIDYSGMGEAQERTRAISPLPRVVVPKQLDEQTPALVWDGEVPATPQHSRARSLRLGLKRGMDIALASAALVALSPVLVATAIAIKATSPGPVLISQPREGRAGVPFRMLKFRTMYHDLGDHTGVAQTRVGDARITPLGRVLRKRSLDELPQLLNVLVGDMSIVGPRPHPIGMLAGGMRYDALVPYYHRRHDMRPGLSGLAQCNGLRGPTDDPVLAVARVHHDLAYIQHFSLLLDARVIARTLVREVVTGTGV